MKLFIIAGHSEQAPGAIAYNGTTEHHYTQELQRLISGRYTGIKVLDNERQSLAEVVMEVNGNSRPGDVGIDLHFNNNNREATGTEVFIYNLAEQQTRDIATEMVNGIARMLNLHVRRHVMSRDYKYPTDLGRNLAIINNTNIPFLLLEVCFLNEFDLPKYISFKRKVAQLIADIYTKHLIK